MQYSEANWQAYCTANQIFSGWVCQKRVRRPVHSCVAADSLAALVKSYADESTPVEIWVHDYHLMLLPGLSDE